MEYTSGQLAQIAAIKEEYYKWAIETDYEDLGVKKDNFNIIPGSRDSLRKQCEYALKRDYFDWSLSQCQSCGSRKQFIVKNVTSMDEVKKNGFEKPQNVALIECVNCCNSFNLRLGRTEVSLTPKK